MIDIVQFPVDMKDPLVSHLGFHTFLLARDLRIVHGGGDERKNVKLLNNPSIDIFFVPHTLSRKDHLHWRSSGVDETMVKLAKKHHIALGFRFDFILRVEGVQRAQLLGRIMQTIRLCHKYNVRMVLCSFAPDVYGLRNASDLQSLGRMLGMTPLEAQQALSFTRKSIGVRFLDQKH